MVQLALVWSPDLPSKEEIRRWFGESIAMLIIPHNCFKLNNSICPVLPAPHSYSVLKFLQYTKCSIVIEPREAFSDKSKSFADYIKFISKRVEVTSSSGNEDSLRFPLQPLYDDLSSATYEIFETDPCKYVKYQMALERAFFDFGEGEDKEKKKIVVLIVGAGRGPLIRAALNASRNTGIKIRTLVVEKNPNAIVTLTSLIKTMWKFDDIKLIAKDMRKVELKEKADILVSELLGSIGDNELSPECLDGAQQLLKPTGISIPSDSVAYIRPVMASKAYSEVIDKKFPMHETGQKSHAEMNWLSYLSNVYFIDKPQELWTFYHPNQDEVIDNNRYKSITFTAKLDCYLHGFSGYFTSTLYKEIEISILPKTHTKGMASWYSMFLPIVSPFMIKKGEKFSLQIWRKVKAEKMVMI